jgi:hypothetical protein
MNHIRIKGGARVAVLSRQAGRRPFRRGYLGVTICGLLAASIALFAASGPAQAATPSASLSIAPASASAGTQPVITYITSGIPAGAVIYLQLSSGPGQQWQDVGRIRAGSGSVEAPADPAGQWSYRILVAQGNTTVVTSASSTFTVSGSGGESPNSSAAPNGAGCTVCKIAKDALPWLAQIAAPAIGSALQSVGQVILDFFGWLIGL